ncbi:MAG: asparagine synthase (glutamine-hydrolyzing) [Armatimonadetes bacterium]|nr:asparagine synthase (glutamine-hydrolyzing) [Armatimonadota bacterium]
MCGIVGIASREPLQDRVGLLAAMRDTMAHRGPDDSGAWWSSDSRVGLAHRRLAIIDLSPGGHQPMLDSTGRLSIAYNGEIYNFQDVRHMLEGLGHAFRTASDTEVILEAYRQWDVECLSRFNGMFAFALFDTDRQRLFMARDRAGEKPLFYRHASGSLVFASELKALMADPAFPRMLDLSALDSYLAYGYVPGDGCMLDGVRKLPQGHALTYDLASDSPRVWRYWDLPDPDPDPNVSAEDLCAELETLLSESVRRQLVADVPVGVLLSGGLDSSLVTAMAAGASSRPVKTFTISFPGHGSVDEGPFARMVADYFGTEHTELAAEPAVVELLPTLARQYDEPLADHSIVPSSLVAKLVRQHATVALGGDGGDELFGGYPHYNFLQSLHRIRSFVPGPMRRAISSAAARAMPVGSRGRNHLVGFGGDLPWSIAHINVYFDESARSRLLSPLGATNGPENYKRGLCDTALSALQQATRTDFRTTMVDGYLVKVDRASMLHSLEIRAPFLDYKLIEFAFGRVPDSLRATDKERKILLRRLAGRILPPGLDLKRKQGFSLPLASWFQGEWGRFTEEVLSEADSSLFDRAFIGSLLEGQRQGKANANRLFALTMFELWRREYRVSLPTQSP